MQQQTIIATKVEDIARDMHGAVLKILGIVVVMSE